MDAVQGFVRGEQTGGPWPPLDIKQFVIAGGGLRGWAVWLTAAHDERVKGIIPIAWDGLAMREQFDLQMDRFGHEYLLTDTSNAWGEYTSRNVFQRFPYDSIWDAKRQQFYKFLTERHQRKVFGDLIDVPVDNDRYHAFEPQTEQSLYDFLITPDPNVADGWELALSVPYLYNTIVNDTNDATVGIWHYMNAESIYWTEPPEGEERVYEDDGIDNDGVLHFSLEAVVGPADYYHLTRSDFMENGMIGGLNTTMAGMIEASLQDNRQDWMYYLIDPDVFNDRYEFAVGNQYFNEFEGRMGMSKYIMAGTNDAYFTPDAGGVYFGPLDDPKVLRYFPNTDHDFVGPDTDGYTSALMQAYPWFVRMSQDTEPPHYSWRVVETEGVGVVEILIDTDNPPTTVWRWEARSRTGRFDDTSIVWSKRELVPLPRPQPTSDPRETLTYVMTVQQDLVDYRGFFAELVYGAYDPNNTPSDTSDDVTESYTTEVVVIKPTFLGQEVGPTADFSSSARQILTGQTVSFYDRSEAGTADIVTWEWDFNNDGMVDATTQDGQHQYTVPGAYSVKLKVTDTNGNTDNVTKIGYIVVSQ